MRVFDMFDFLFKKKESVDKGILISEIFPQLKLLFKGEISQERKQELSELIDSYGYLPYPHIRALEELTPAETIFVLELKLKKSGVYDGDNFTQSETSPVDRAGIKNSDWIKKEGHDIKLINLAGLGDGNVSAESGKFVDWLKQLVILPSGNQARGILSTTIYLIPFHPREFGCAYLPTSSDVSVHLEDSIIKEKLGLDAKAQVKLFIQLAQLAGHPVIYDILPQTGRYSKIVLANPEVARWYDIKELTAKIQGSLDAISKTLESKYDNEDIEIIKNIFKQGSSGDLSEEYQKIYDDFEIELLKLKKSYSLEMTKRENQIKLHKKVRSIIAQIQEQKNNKQLDESDITKQNDVIQALIKEELWTAPGGAWCSSGVPVFDKMSECKTYPIFSHYDFEDNDVTHLANLDCQTPFYFVFLENGQYNKPVIDFFIDYMLKLQAEHNFDGFRVDHVDHIVDEVSERNGAPISYRIPRKVLGELNSKIKQKVPHFATLAEYMLGGHHFKEYHEDMKFDVLWGNDIPAQSEKTPEKIVEDNQDLEHYNSKNFAIANLSILKSYNNQDGEFSVIDRYPAQLGETGAIFKWFKYKFLPGGKNAQRPVLYIDGDESFTKTGIEETIGNEVSMKRGKNYDFYAKFDAISRFAKSQELITEGEAQIILQEDDGFVSWMISKEPLKSAFLVVANYNAPTEKVSTEKNGKKITEVKKGYDVSDKSVILPGDYSVKAEIFFDGKDFVERNLDESENSLTFDKLEPSEFRIFLLNK